MMNRSGRQKTGKHIHLIMMMYSDISNLLFRGADIAIANFEVTLAGPPYMGYPQFSSPAALASACKNAGIDYLVTANNHAADRGKMVLPVRLIGSTALEFLIPVPF